MATRSVLALTVATGSAVALLLGAPSSPPHGQTPEGRAPTPTELLPAVVAAFARESYAPETTATLVVSNKALGLKLQVFHSGPERLVTRSDSTMNGIPVSAKFVIGASRGRKLVTVGSATGRAGSTSPVCPQPTGASGSRPSSSGRPIWASIGLRSSCRP